MAVFDENGMIPKAKAIALNRMLPPFSTREAIAGEEWPGR
jgi:hypothetical protein